MLPNYTIITSKKLISRFFFFFFLWFYIFCFNFEVSKHKCATSQEPTVSYGLFGWRGEGGGVEGSRVV